MAIFSPAVSIMDRKVLKAPRQTRFEETWQAALKAVETAPDGQWIAGREWQAQEAFQKLTVDCCREILQSRIHASPPENQAGKACLGETPAASAWAKARREEIKTLGVQPVLLAIAELHKKVRSPAKKKQLRLLRDYLRKHLEMLDYKSAWANGRDLGSGSTEARCMNLTLCRKRTGRKGNAANAEARMNLTALYARGQQKAGWSQTATRKAA